jgi:hypothetical protein
MTWSGDECRATSAWTLDIAEHSNSRSSIDRLHLNMTMTKQPLYWLSFDRLVVLLVLLKSVEERCAQS